MEFEHIFALVQDLFSKWGYWLIFVGSLIEITPLGWTVPGGGILLVAGYLAKVGGEVSLVSVLALGTIGAWLAFLLAYWLGRKTGMWLVIKTRQQDNARLAKVLLENHGGMILTTSMLANLTRFWISYVAGIDRYSFIKFSFYGLISSFTWVSMMTLLGYFAGYESDNINKLLGSLGVFSWVLLIVSLWVLVKYIRRERKIFLGHKDLVQ